MTLEKQTYNVKEVAELLGLSRVTVGRAVRESKLPATIEAGGKRLVWVKIIIDDWIKNGCPPVEKNTFRKKYKRKKNGN